MRMKTAVLSLIDCVMFASDSSVFCLLSISSCKVWRADSVSVHLLDATVSCTFFTYQVMYHVNASRYQKCEFTRLILSFEA